MRRPTPPNYIVCLEQVDVRYQGATVLESIDWTLKSGEHWGVIGPNGSGKSSFLAIVAGQIWPAPGKGARTYRFDGREHVDAVEAKQRITIVGPELQNRYAKLGWNFSALDVVLTGIFHSDIPRRSATASERDRAACVLARLGLSALRDRRFLELSRGEQRRVLIARGIAFEPLILLLDEPASGLDPIARRGLEDTIQHAGESAAIIASAHRIEDLPAIVSHCLELGEGRIQSQGPVGDISKYPQRRPEPVGLARSDLVDSPGDAPLVRIRHADVWLADRHVLKDVNWVLERGQHWLVTGPNGAGKTSFLRLLHGQLRPARGGTIEWPGLGNPRNVWNLRGKIGWVSPELQAAYRFPTKVFECVASGFKSSIGLTHRLSAEQTERVNALIADFELAELRDRLLSSLSYGQFRRALIARTFAAQPRLLLMDEPWEGLDSDSIEIVRSAIGKAAESGTQLVCISHIGNAGLEFTHEMKIEAGRISETAHSASNARGAA